MAYEGDGPITMNYTGEKAAEVRHTHIAEEAESLLGTSDDLHSILDELTKAMERVLLPAMTSPSDETPEPVRSPLAQTLALSRGRVYFATQRIRDLIERLDI